jgi:alanine racemase
VNRAARATIDSAALRSNLRAAAAQTAGSRVMAVIKANAYGHGIVPAARALAAADAFGVARLEEAVAIRHAGLANRIVLLEGVFHVEQLGLAAEMGLELVVHDPVQIEMLEAAGGSHRYPVWLKLDTGMNRLGFEPARAGDLVRRLRACAAVGKNLHLMTHLACADQPADATTAAQIDAFNAAIAGLAGERSIANSAGLMAWRDSHADWVRPGIMLYGVSPFADSTGPELGLRPVMTLASELIAVKRVPAGARVGYGGVWTAPEETPIGVAAIGYGDGYSRHIGSGTPVLVGGFEARIVGRISMDLITIDLGSAPDARVGDPVVLWGDGLPVELLARAAGTIPYELLCGVTQRVGIRVV